jgi:isopentenyl-diphosphate delta-isomerase
MTNINLVDKNGKRIGSMEKLEAHRKGELHEAFSIFIFNKKNELLLQQRALDKYHSGGLWSNTVCSHPKFGEELCKAVQRRLKEEMGFSTPLQEIFSFTYKSFFKNGITEYEFDYIFVGKYNKNPKPDKKEVMDYKWISLTDLKKDIGKNPSVYTSWLKIILESEEFGRYFF